MPLSTDYTAIQRIGSGFWLVGFVLVFSGFFLVFFCTRGFILHGIESMSTETSWLCSFCFLSLWNIFDFPCLGLRSPGLSPLQLRALSCFN